VGVALANPVIGLAIGIAFAAVFIAVESDGEAQVNQP
jgi:type III secretory pathway component EscT